MALNTVSSARLSTNVKTSNLNSGFGQLGNRNLSINGADMMVAQRGTSTTGLQNTGGIFTIDRFAHRRGGTWANAEWKDEQVDSGTGLFKKALKKTTTTAEGSAAASGKFVMIGHYLEVQDTVSAFGDGTAEAKSFTVSFYVKASIATTYCLHVATSHLTTNKAYMKQFTVNNPNVWERKTCTIPAITNSIGTRSSQADTFTGIRFHWVLDAPTRASSQAADTWFTFTDSDYGYPTGQGPTGYANTLNATFELGGVQIEAGTEATELEHRTFVDELAKCQRYFYRFTADNGDLMGLGMSVNANNHYMLMLFPQPMRAIPSYTGSSGTNLYFLTQNTTALIDTSNMVLSIPPTTPNPDMCIMYGSTSGTGTAGQAALVQSQSDGIKMSYNAEM
tara:strand:+ start:185 stop:1360 length:1176 start_codon:yes stop_codon:yes gene_type:complete